MNVKRLVDKARKVIDKEEKNQIIAAGGKKGKF